MDTSKKEQAIKIIASKIIEQPVNTDCDYGTAAYFQNMTRREAEAFSLARYCVIRMGGKFSGKLPEDWTEEERESFNLANEMASAAIAITGK